MSRRYNCLTRCLATSGCLVCQIPLCLCGDADACEQSFNVKFQNSLENKAPILYDVEPFDITLKIFMDGLDNSYAINSGILPIYLKCNNIDEIKEFENILKEYHSFKYKKSHFGSPKYESKSEKKNSNVTVHSNIFDYSETSPFYRISEKETKIKKVIILKKSTFFLNHHKYMDLLLDTTLLIIGNENVYEFEYINDTTSFLSYESPIKQLMI